MNTPRIKTLRQRPNGFTLMELLIVISIIVILLLLAVPNYMKFKMQGNETSAMRSLKTINTSQTMYEAAYPSIGFSCTLQALGGEHEATNTATASGMLTGDLPSGTKDGYNFTITCPQQGSNSAKVSSYKVTAVPTVPGKTGSRGFCMDEGGTVMADPTGGTNCTQLAQ